MIPGRRCPHYPTHAQPRPRPHRTPSQGFTRANGKTRRRRATEAIGRFVVRRIADHLFVSSRTVAAHIEHILVKLNAPTRTLAAERAMRQGLYVPPSLDGVQPS
jgi:hypothetical protein